MHRDKAYFLDIYNSAKISIQYLSNLSYNEFLTNIQTQDAVIEE